MYVTPPQEFHPVEFMVEWYLQNRKQNTFSGVTKTASMRREAAQQAFREGVALGLANIANCQRIEQFSKWDTVPMLIADDMVRFLKQIEKKYVEVLEVTSARGEDKKVLVTEYYRWVNQEFDNFILPAALIRQEAQRHREAVLALTEEATPEDSEWLKEELEKAQRASKQVQDILAGKVEG